MWKNKSFDVRGTFGAIYGASKSKKYLLKNSTIGNRLLLSELAITEFTFPKIETGVSFFLTVIYF